MPEVTEGPQAWPKTPKPTTLTASPAREGRRVKLGSLLCLAGLTHSPSPPTPANQSFLNFQTLSAFLVSAQMPVASMRTFPRPLQKEVRTSTVSAPSFLFSPHSLSGLGSHFLGFLASSQALNTCLWNQHPTPGTKKSIGENKMLTITTNGHHFPSPSALQAIFHPALTRPRGK